MALRTHARTPACRVGTHADARCGQIVHTPPGCREESMVSLETTLPRIRLDGVVAFAGLRFQIFVGELDVELALAAVLGVVEGSVADGVLAAHFVLHLLEDDVQGVPAVHPVDVAAGVVGETVERAGATSTG